MDYAARKAWAFDPIYRKYIDPKYLGGDVEGGYDGRLKLFSEREVEESKEVKLGGRDPEDARVLGAGVFGG